MKYRTIKWGGAKIRLPETVEWQGHELKLERHVDEVTQWANWYFRNERITLHLFRWLNIKEGDRDCYTLNITWELEGLVLNNQSHCTELSMIVRGSKLDYVLERATERLNDLYETLPEDFPE